MNINNFEFGIYEATFNAGVRPANRSITIKNNGRAKHGFLYLFSGAVTFSMPDGKTIVSATAGDLVYIPQYAKYKLCYKAQTHFSLMNFDAKTATQKDVCLSDTIEVLLRENTDAQITKLFKSVEDIFAYESKTSAFRRKELIYRLFSYISLSFSNCDERIINGVQMLEHHYLEDFPIADLAKASYMGVSTFRKRFTAQFGMSPLKYRNQLRMNRAHQLLSDRDYTIAEIAEMSGFGNENYFCRLYKQMYGKTPKQQD